MTSQGAQEYLRLVVFFFLEQLVDRMGQDPVDPAAVFLPGIFRQPAMGENMPGQTADRGSGPCARALISLGDEVHCEGLDIGVFAEVEASFF